MGNRYINLGLCLVMSAASMNAGAVVLFSDDFSTDMGWTGYETDYWERGSATAGGGADGANPDPSADHTATGDNFLIGVNIGGDGPTTDNDPHYLTSPVIDCSGETHVQVRFYRWLNAWGASQSNTDLEVYDGSSWRRVFASRFMEDNAWVERIYDVSLYAANNASFQVRFKFEYESTLLADGRSNWNVDDFEVSTFVGEANQFVDGDFEADLSDWALNLSGSNMGGGRHHTVASAFVTNGDGAIYHFTNNNFSVTAGSFRGYQQDIDLTNIASIEFDALHRNGTHIAARGLIDGVEEWRQDTPGTYLDQSIDVSGMTGIHTFQLQMLVTVSDSGFSSEWVQFDNVRTVAIPSLTDIYVDLSGLNGDGSIGSPFNNLAAALASVADSGTIHMDSGNSTETFTAGSAIGAGGKVLTLVNETPGSGSVFIGAAMARSESRTGFVSRGKK